MNLDLAPGVIIGGRYRLDRLLGRGGMGQVWAVTHEVTHRAAALKLLNGPIHLRADSRRRFLREARAASAVNHPNVVRVHDFFELEDGTPVMLMDLLEGETLKQRLVREGPLPLGETVRVLLPVVSAVGTAHARGIVHRDLKPDNVFLARSESGALDVRVLDFGVAKLVHAAASGDDDSEALTGAGGVLGTPSYMSPEQSFGDGSVDHRADIWSLGVLLYEVLSGSRPVDGATVGQVLARLMSEVITPIEVLVPELPRDVSELVGSMLQRDPAARPQDLREVHEVLSRHASVKVPEFGAAVGEPPPPVDSGPMSAPRSSRAVIRVTADSDPRAMTHAAPDTVVSDPMQSGPSVEMAPVRPRLRWPARAAGLLLVAAALAVPWLLASPKPTPSVVEGAGSAAVAIPPAGVQGSPHAVSEAERAAPAASTEVAQGPSLAPSAAERPRAAAAPPRPITSAKAPRNSAAPASPVERKGLVDEPPF